jgi:lactoylglutathione lyase
MHARETRPAGGTLHGNLADGRPCPLRSIPYTPPGTTWLTDPDGYRTELVEWPAGHAAGITDADFA